MPNLIRICSRSNSELPPSMQPAQGSRKSLTGNVDRQDIGVTLAALKKPIAQTADCYGPKSSFTLTNLCFVSCLQADALSMCMSAFM
jgi:hypothetical protein